MKVLISLICLFSPLLYADGLKDYYEMTNRWSQPWDTLKFASDRFEEEGLKGGLAIDLGCGAAKDTPFLIQEGWTVIAIDIEPSAESYLKRKIPSAWQSRLHFQCTSFEAFPFTQKVYLINASCALPYCHPWEFDKVMQRIRDALLPGGRFSGHFFGIHDQWANDPDMTFLTQEQILNLFPGFTMELFEEKEWEGESGPHKKHWHSFKVVAKKN